MKPKWNSSDTRWVLSLFGTAIGAGVLFLPINAGLGGLVPLIVILALAYPMTYLAHRGLCRFVLSSSNPNDDITFVSEGYFGKSGGFLVTLLYFFAILPILLVYSGNLTTTLINFLQNQIQVSFNPSDYRLIISFIIVTILMAISILGEEIITKVMSVLVFPFIVVLVIIALFLIPYWNGAIFTHADFSSVGSENFWMTLWLVIPVMVFAFNHSPIISSLACHCKKEYGEYAEEKASNIISYSVLLMVVVVMFFVFSCALTLTPQDFADAKSQNVNILTYIANKFPEATFLAWLAPIVALVAMSKSYLGHYLGSQEGLNGILYKVSDGKIKGSKANFITGVFTFVVAWLVAWKNPSAIGIIESIGGPVLAILLFIMPVYCIYKFDILKKFRHPALDTFTFIMGLIAISAAIKNLI